MSSVASSRSSSRGGLAAVSAGALLWGTTGVAVSIIHERTGLAAVATGWYRVAIAAVVVALVLRRPGVRRAVAATRAHPLLMLGAGVLFGAYQAMYFVGVQEVGVGVATLVSLGLAPVALTIGTAVARRRRPSPLSLAVLGLALAGLILVSLGPGGGDGSALLGVLVSVGSGLGYAATTALTARLSDEQPLVITGVTSTIGACALLPLAVPAGIAWPTDDLVSTGWLVYIGIVPTVLAYVLFYRGLRTTPSEIAGVITLLEPLAATVLAAVVLHERLTGAALLGGGLMLVAIAVLYLRPPEVRPLREDVPPP